MRIIPIASTSKGCCYIIEQSDQAIMIDCGVNLRTIRRVYSDFGKIKGCFISHEHGDHAFFLPYLARETAIPIYCNMNVTANLGIRPVKYLYNHLTVKLKNGFRVKALKLDHDVETFGFLITHSKSNEKLLYASDTRVIKYNILGLTRAMIEANFDFQLISESERYQSVIIRTLKTHQSIDAAIDFIRRHPTLKEIWLIHLSKAHADPDDFIKRAENAAGVPVYVAKS